jgi:hypothetical protein
MHKGLSKEQDKEARGNRKQETGNRKEDTDKVV